MVCCKCNKHSKCRKCACVRAGNQCSNCLPSRLGYCDNQQRTAVQEDINSELVPTTTAPSPARETMSSARESPPTDQQVPSLPGYPSPSLSTFSWGSLNGADFTKLLDNTYNEVIHWRRNCFSVPTGKDGREFVSEVARLYQAFGSASALESVALKATIVLPILLLQKPSKVSKTKNHVKCLERRLQHWVIGDLEELTREGRTIQQRLPKGRTAGADSNLARTFSNLMFKGKCKAALGLLSVSGKGDVLHLDGRVDFDDPSSPSVREALLQKYPPAQQVHPECIIDEEPQEPHPVIFESLDALLFILLL